MAFSKFPCFMPQDPFEARILGVDEQSYFHLGITNRSELYQQMKREIELAVRDQPCLPKHVSRQRGLNCIVKVATGPLEGKYVRGITVNTNPQNGNVTCKMVDSFGFKTVPQSNVFAITQDILSFPAFSLRCKLAEMEFFLGERILKAIYARFIGLTAYDIASTVYKIEVTESSSLAPTVQITTPDGFDLSEIFLEIIPDELSIKYPLVGKEVDVKVFDYNSDTGQLLFQPMDNIVIKTIQNRLSHYLALTLSAPHSENRSARTNVMPRNICLPPTAGDEYIYTLPPKKGKRFRSYRVYAWKKENGQVVVNYMDDGHLEEAQPGSYLALAHSVDPMLSKIPPQCLSAKFVGFETVKLTFEQLAKLGTSLGEMDAEHKRVKITIAMISSLRLVEENGSSRVIPPMLEIFCKEPVNFRPVNPRTFENVPEGVNNVEEEETAQDEGGEIQTPEVGSVAAAPKKSTKRRKKGRSRRRVVKASRPDPDNGVLY